MFSIHLLTDDLCEVSEISVMEIDLVAWLMIIVVNLNVFLLIFLYEQIIELIRNFLMAWCIVTKVLYVVFCLLFGINCFFPLLK